MKLPEVSEVRHGYLVVFGKYKCVTFFFVQGLRGLTLSL